MGTKTVLMVEGKDDQHVVMHVCGARGLGKINVIQPYDGIQPLTEAIGIRVKESDLAALGILVDADTDLAARWQSVRQRLLSAGYDAVPDIPAKDGTVITAPAGSILPRVGIWLMPDNTVPGILEDFLAFLVPDGDPLFAHVERSLTTIPEASVRFTSVSAPKAKIHTWLAWQSEPGKPLGQAISSRYLDARLPGGDHFAGWLQRTFFQ
jgi:hypothetical protein